jgi:glycine cleavage system H protein
MSNTPKDLRYTKDHEWVRLNGKIATIGITDHAQKQLGDIVFVELPYKVGDNLNTEDELGTVESVKAVTEVFAPLSGNVTEINEQLHDSPETLNDDPYGEGWLLKLTITDSKEMDRLLKADEYDKYCQPESD